MADENLWVNDLYIIITIVAASVAGNPIVNLKRKFPAIIDVNIDFNIAINIVDLLSNR